MSLRRAAPLAVALGLAACTPSVTENTNPQFLDYAVFDPAAVPPAIPVPNDIALASLANPATAPGGAQGELLRAFAAAGGFPNDQEVPVVFDFVRTPIGGTPSVLAPDLDIASLKFCPAADCNLLLLQVADGVPTPLDATKVDVTYTTSGNLGTLTIRNMPDPVTKSRRWLTGAKYIVALRGGPSGVKTLSGGTFNPQPAMFLLLQGKELTKAENQTLFTAEQKAAGAPAQLEQIRLAYVTGAPSVFRLLDPPPAGLGFGFPHDEIADIATFAIAPAAGTYVVVDESAGVVPLPSDLLLDPATGKVRPGIATGLEKLDGFSTTGMIAALTSGLITASTVQPNVFLFELTSGGPVRVCDLIGQITSACSNANYVAQPSVIIQSGFSPAIGLQPAVPAQVGPTVFTLPPLKEGTEYAVVITKSVLDAAGSGLIPNTVAKILLFSNPISVGGRSQLVGIDDGTAAGLEGMRKALTPVLAAAGVAKNQVAMAYTFKTQSVTGTSVTLSAAPYSAETGAAQAIFTPTAAAAFDTTTVGIPAAAFPDVAEFVSATVPTFDTWDKTTGALATPAASGLPWPVADLLPVLVAVPLAANVPPSCPPPANALKCAPLVIFHHGLNGGHLQMLSVANQLAKAGFVVAATDMPFHGDRAYCKQNSDCTTGAADGVCTPIPGTATQGDAVPPGICTTGALKLGTSLTSVASGNYFVSANFFRTRDGIRRDLLDQSALVLAMARPPSPYPQPAANPLAARLANTDGVAVDITKVYYLGISLGGIMGTEVVATNPRFSRAVLNVPGGTVVDIFTNSPSFRPQVEQLIAASIIPGFTFAKVTPGDPSFDPVVAAEYLKLVIVMKWILDPADPLNFAASVDTKLPSPLSAALGPLASATTDAWGMMANGDTVIPNPFTVELFGVGAIPFTLYVSASAPGNVVPHGFLASSTTAQDQAAIFLTNLTIPSSPQTLP